MGVTHVDRSQVWQTPEAAQPAMSRIGEDLKTARAAPGLALIAAEDAANSNGTPAQHHWAADRAGARVAVGEPEASRRGADTVLAHPRELDD